MVVDGEHFEVCERVSESGVYDVRWTSGPSADYGFTTSAYSGARQTDTELEEAIRDFLSRSIPSLDIS